MWEAGSHIWSVIDYHRNVCIYTGNGESDYQALYKGAFEHVPAELFERRLFLAL